MASPFNIRSESVEGKKKKKMQEKEMATSIQMMKSWTLDLNCNPWATELNRSREDRRAIPTPCHQVKNTIDLNIKNLANGFICINSFFVTA